MPNKVDLGQEHIRGFYNGGSFGDHLLANKFDLGEETARLIALARCDDPKVSLSALRHFRHVLSEVAEKGGMVIKKSISSRKNGTRFTATTRTTLPVIEDPTNVVETTKPPTASLYQPPKRLDGRTDAFVLGSDETGSVDPERAGPAVTDA